MPPPYQDILDHILIDSERLQRRIAEIGNEISEDYRDAHSLVMIGILKGSTLFLADLMRQIRVPHMIDFLAISSYGSGARASSGVVRILMDLRAPIEGQHVLIVEDIIDSGYTLDYVLRLLSTQQPASLSICTLLDKADRREVEVPIKYVGFQIPNAFVFGYGLDIDEYYRNLPFIGVVKDGVNLTQEHE
ncbi:MAG: hypoxanthine phosphoribosyltransferase [Anaerolineae bacterium]|nr:hypoxanthine phosphoribosyltransferase [Anaerolineae bacterium]